MIARTSTVSEGPPVGSQREDAVTNIAMYLPRMALEVPGQRAVVVGRGMARGGAAACRSLTFAELEALSNRYASGLRAAGFARGMRVLMMVRPGFSFIGLSFALFKLGAVPVMIDPGMGVSRMLECIRGVALEGFIGIPLAQVMRVLRRGAFRSVTRVVTVGRRWGWGGTTLREIARRGSDDFEPEATRAEETAAILFTSGSTGPAKGVVYEHGMFDAQVRMIQSHYGIEPGEVDLPAFPLFALFSTAMGMTCVIPQMDPSHPARVNPAKIVRAIQDHGVTNTFGSPAIWRRVAPYCVERGIRLPSLRRVLIAGAPVPWGTIEQLRSVMAPGADVHTPYGATEALPVCSISGAELMENAREPGGCAPESERKAHNCVEAARRGAGTCVGHPLPEVAVRVIRLTDEPVERWSDDLVLAEGEMGEIVVRGSMVTRSYYGLPQATALAKIVDGDRVWHRMGDAGYRDEFGRIWFCGRKSQRIETTGGTWFADSEEAVFNAHPAVARTAVVGVGRRGAQRAVLVVELKDGTLPRGTRRKRLMDELMGLGRARELFEDDAAILFHRRLPTDVRHNAKLQREALARWAAARLP